MSAPHQVSYHIEDELFTFRFEGSTYYGKEEVLLDNDINLLLGTPWNSPGYTIQLFVNADDFLLIKTGLQEIIACLIKDNGGSVDSNFNIESYHQYVNDDIHLRVAKTIQWGIPVDQFPVNFEIINNRISEILNKKVSAVAKHINLNNFFLRIVRPKAIKDNNPPHRDVWLDRLRNAINIYAPICGSTIQSSLALIPGSHFFKESDILRTSDGAYLNETQYTVPCVVAVKGNVPKLIRPNPKENEVMVFSPYLVHGGGYNLNEHQTRISLEMRFWKYA